LLKQTEFFAPGAEVEKNHSKHERTVRIHAAKLNRFAAVRLVLFG